MRDIPIDSGAVGGGGALTQDGGKAAWEEDVRKIFTSAIFHKNPTIVPCLISQHRFWTIWDKIIYGSLSAINNSWFGFQRIITVMSQLNTLWTNRRCVTCTHVCWVQKRSARISKKKPTSTQGEYAVFKPRTFLLHVHCCNICAAAAWCSIGSMVWAIIRYREPLCSLSCLDENLMVEAFLEEQILMTKNTKQ